MRTVTAVLLSTVVGTGALALAQGGAAAGGTPSVVLSGANYAVTVADDLPAAPVTFEVRTDASVTALTATLVSPAGAEAPIVFSSAESAEGSVKVWTDSEVFDSDDARGTWRVLRYLVASQDRVGWHAPVAATVEGPELSVTVSSRVAVQPSAPVVAVAAAVAPESSAQASPAPPVDASTAPVSGALPAANASAATTAAAAPAGVGAGPAVAGSSTRPVQKAYDAAVVRATARNSHIAINLDSRLGSKKVRVLVLQGRRWIDVGTVTLNARGDATLSVPLAHRALLRKGAYLRFVSGKTLVASARLRF